MRSPSSSSPPLPRPHACCRPTRRAGRKHVAGAPSLLVVLVLSGRCAQSDAAEATTAREVSRARFGEERARGGTLRSWGELLLGRRGGPRAPRLRGGHQDDGEGQESAPHMIDLTGDRGVLKMTTRTGIEGTRPVERDEVYLHFNGSIECLDNRSTVYNGRNISGVQFDSTTTGSGAGLPRSFQVGGGNTLAAWELAVRNMSKGERATILVHSDFGYGSLGRTTRAGVFIPPNATLRFELELLRWNEKDLHNDGGVMVSYRLDEELDSPNSDNHPEVSDQVLVRFTGRHKDQVYSTSGAGPVWVSLSDEWWMQSGPRAGGDALPPATLPRGLLNMLTAEAVKGGRYNVSLSSDYAYGSKGLEADWEGRRVCVPPNASVEFEVELLDWNTVTDR